MSDKPKDWRIPFVEAWKNFRKSVGRPCAMNWGALMNRVYHMTKTVDEMTGEILIEELDIEEWNRQLEGFRVNEYAKNANYPFDLFQSQYGQYVPPKKKVGTWHCPSCGERDSMATHKCKPLEMPANVTALFGNIGTPLEPKPFLCKDCNMIHSPNFICMQKAKAI